MLRIVDLNELRCMARAPEEVILAFAQAATLLGEPSTDWRDLLDWQDLRRLASPATIRKILEFDKDSIQERAIQ